MLLGPLLGFGTWQSKMEACKLEWHHSERYFSQNIMMD